MVRFLELFKPIAPFIPEVKTPERKVSFNKRLTWTILVMVIYLLMGEIQLYGIDTELDYIQSSSIQQVIFASNEYTLLELGIGPIVTAGLIIQLLAGAFIDFDRSNPDDRALFATVSKLFSILMIMLQAVLLINTGKFGMDFNTKLVIFAQLMATGLVIILLDEMVQKGWGIGSGISLFIVAGITKTIWWQSLAFVTVGDNKMYGAIPAFIQAIMNGESVTNWFYRIGGLPSMIGLFSTIVVFAFVIYIEGMRVELPLAHASYRGFRSKMPIKLLYVSNIPVILAYTLFQNVYLVGQWVSQSFNPDNSNQFFNLIAMYNQSNPNQPIGGITYYLTSPRTLEGIAADPVRALLYFLVIVGTCVFMSLIWLEIGGIGPDDVADQLLGSGMQVPGFRRSKKPLVALLNRYIPTITVIGGLIIGILAAFSEYFGVFSSGMGALLCVSIMYQYYQTMVQEQVDELYPFLRGALK